MADTSHNPQEVSKVESVNHTFTWRHGEPDTVIVTGTFDGWSKENVMDRSTVSSEEQNHEEQVQFTKTVQIPVDLTPVLYKYVVDGKWAHDPLHETATGDDGIVNNVLHTQIKSDDHFTQEAQVESDTSLQEAVQPVMHEDNREDEAIDLGPVSAVKDEASDNEPSVPDDPSEVNSPDVPLIKGESEEVGVATQFQTESSPVNADSTDTPSGASKDLSGSASDDVAESKTLEVTSVVTDDVTSSQPPAEGSSITENSLPVTDDHAVSTIPKSLTDNVEANHESTTTALPETEDGAVVAAAEKQPTEAEQEPVNSNTQDSSVTPETDKAAKPVPQESAAKDIQESSESVVPNDRVTPNTECLEIIGHTDAAVNVEADKADVQAELPQHDVAGITFDDSLPKTVKDVGPKEITVNVPLDKEESTSVGSIPNQAEDPATVVDPTSTTKECPDEVGLGVTTSAPEDVISEVHNPAPCSQGDSEQTPSNPEDVVPFVANDNPVTMESKDEAESLDTNSLSEESTKPADEQSEYDNPVSEPARLNEVNREPTSAEPEHSTSNNSIDNEEKRTEANGSVAEVLLAADTEEGEVASREIENTVIPDIPSEKKIGNEEDSGFVATESADAVEEISVPIHPVEDIAVVRDHISEETVTEAIATKGDSEAVSTLPDAVPAETDVTDQQPQVEQEVVAVEEISETDAVVPGTTDEVPEDPQTVADSISQSVEVERVEITTTDETAQISEEVKTTKTNSGEEAPEGVEKESTVPESTDKATESTEVSEESPATIDAAVDNVTNAEDIGEAISSQDTEVTIAAVTKAVKVEEDVAKENFQDESTETATTVAAAAEVVTETVKVVSERTIVEGVSDVPQSVDNACLQVVEEETGPEIVEESVIHNVSDDTAEGSTAEVVVEVSENVANSGISSENVIEAGINIDSIAAESTEVTTKPVELSEETSGAVELPDDSNAPAETASEVIATEVMEESVSNVPDAATAEAVVAAEQQQVDLVEVAVEEVLKNESVAPEPAEKLSEVSEVVEAAISQPVDVVEVENSTPEVISEISEVNTTESQSDDVVGEDIEGKSTTSESIKPSAESTEVSKESPATIDTTADNTATTECVDEAITSRDTEVAVATLPETIAVEDLVPEKLEDKLTETTAAIATETEVVAESIEVDTEPVTAKDDVDVPQSVEDVVPQTVDEVQVEPTIVEEVSTVSQEVVIPNTSSEEMVEGGDDANSIAVESTEVIVEASGNACAIVAVPAMESSTDDVGHESVTAEATEDPAAALPDSVVVEPDVAVDQSLPEPSEPIENETSETDVIVSDAVEKVSGPAVVEEIAEVPQIVDESVIDSVCDEKVEAVPAEVAAEGSQEVVIIDSHSEMIVEGGDDSEFVSTESHDTPKESPVSIDSSEEVEVLGNDCEEAVTEDIAVEATEKSVSTVPDAVSADADVSLEQPQVASVELAAEEYSEAEVIVPEPTEEVSEVPHSVDDSISQTVEVDKMEITTPEAVSEIPEEVNTTENHSNNVVLQEVERESAVPESTETPVESVEVSEESPAKIDTAVDSVEDIVESSPSQDVDVTIATVPKGVPVEEDAATEMPLGESTETTTTVVAETEVAAASTEVETEPASVKADNEVPKSVEDAPAKPVVEDQVEPTNAEDISAVSQQVVATKTSSEDAVENVDNDNSIVAESANAEANEELAAVEPCVVSTEPDVAVDQSQAEPSEPIEEGTSEADVIVPEVIEKESGHAVLEEIAEVPQAVDESVIDSVCDEKVEALPAEVTAEGPQEVVNTDSHSEMIVEDGEDSEFVSTESTDIPKESPVSINSSEEVEVLGNDCEEALAQDIDVEATEESVSTVPDAVSADADVPAEQPQVASVELAAEEYSEAEVIVPEPTEEVSEVPHSVDDSISQTVEVDKVENSTPEAASEVVEEEQIGKNHSDNVVLQEVERESADPESTETPVESVEVSEESPAKIDTAVDNVEDNIESVPSQVAKVDVSAVPETVTIKENVPVETPQDEPIETSTTVTVETEVVAEPVDVETKSETVKDDIDVPKLVEDVVPQTVNEVQMEPATVEEVSTVSQVVVTPDTPSEEKIENGSDGNSIVIESAEGTTESPELPNEYPASVDVPAAENSIGKTEVECATAEAEEVPTTAEPQVVAVESEVAAKQCEVEQVELIKKRTSEADFIVSEAIRNEPVPVVSEEVLEGPQPVEASVIPTVDDYLTEALSADVAAEVSGEVTISDTSLEKVVEDIINTQPTTSESTEVTTESSELFEETSASVEAVRDDGTAAETIADGEAVFHMPDTAIEQPQVQHEEIATQEILKTEHSEFDPTVEVIEESRMAEVTISQSVEVNDVVIGTPEAVPEIREEVNTTVTHSNEVVLEGVEGECLATESAETSSEPTKVFEETPATIDTAVEDNPNTEDIGEAIPNQDTEVVVAAAPETITIEEDVAAENPQDEPTDNTVATAAESEVVAEPAEVVIEPLTVNDVDNVLQSVEDVVPQTVDEVQVKPTIVDEVSTVSQEVVIPNTSEEMVEGGDDANSIAVESTEVIVEAPGNACATVDVPAMENSTDDVEPESVTAEATEGPAAALPDVAVEQSQVEPAETIEKGTSEADVVVSELVEKESSSAIVEEIDVMSQPADESVVCMEEVSGAKSTEEVLVTGTPGNPVECEGNTGFVATNSTDVPKEAIDTSEEPPVTIESTEKVEDADNPVRRDAVGEVISSEATEESVASVVDAPEEQPQLDLDELTAEGNSEDEIVVPDSKISEGPQTDEVSSSQSVEVPEVEISTTEVVPEVFEEVEITVTHSDDVVVEGVGKELASDKCTEIPVESTEISDESPTAIDTAVEDTPNTEDIGDAITSQDTEVTVAVVPEITTVEDVVTENSQNEPTDNTVITAAESEVVAELIEVVAEPLTVNDVDDEPQSVEDAAVQIINEVQPATTILEKVSVVSQKTVITETPLEVVEDEDDAKSIVAEATELPVGAPELPKETPVTASAIVDLRTMENSMGETEAESADIEATQVSASAEEQGTTAESDVDVQQSLVEPAELIAERTSEAEVVLSEIVKEEVSPVVVGEVPEVPQAVEESIIRTVTNGKVEDSSAEVAAEASEEVENDKATSEKIVEVDISNTSVASETAELVTESSGLSEETSANIEADRDDGATPETVVEAVPKKDDREADSSVLDTAQADVAVEQPQLEQDETPGEGVLKSETVATDPSEEVPEEKQILEDGISQTEEVHTVEISTTNEIAELSEELKTTEAHSDGIVTKEVEGEPVSSKSTEIPEESTEVSQEPPTVTDTAVEGTITTQYVDEAIPNQRTEVAITIEADHAVETPQEEPTEKTITVASETEAVAESIEVDTEPATAKDDVDVPQSVEDVVPQTVDEVQVEPTIVDEVSTVSQEVVIPNTSSEEMVEGGDDANSIAVESTEVIVEASGNACAIVAVPAMESSTDDVGPESVTAEATEDPAAALPDAVVAEPDVAVDQSLPEPSEPIENETSETDVIVSDAVEKVSGPAVVEEIAEVPQIVDESVIDSVCDEKVEAVPAEVAAEGSQEVVIIDSHSEMIVEGGDDSEFVSTESHDTPKESPVSIDSSEEVEVLGNDCEEAVTEDIAVEATEKSVSTVPDAVSADADVSLEQPQVASVELAAEEYSEAEVIVPEPTEEVSEVPHSVDDSISQTVEVDKMEITTPEAASEVVEEEQTGENHSDNVVLQEVERESAVPESTETPVESVEVSEGSPARIDTAVDSVEDIVESIPSQDVEVTIATLPESVPIEEDAATEMPLGESTETTTTVAFETEAVAASIEVETEPASVKADNEVPKSVEDAPAKPVVEDQVEPANAGDISAVSQQVVATETSSEDAVENADNANSIATESANAEATEDPAAALPDSVVAEPDVAVDQSQAEPSEPIENGTSEADVIVPEAIEKESGPVVVEEIAEVPQAVDESVIDSVRDEKVEALPTEVAAEGSQEVVNTDSHSEMIVEGGEDSEFVSTESTDTPKESPVSIDSSEEVEVLGNDCEEALAQDIAVEATEESVSTVSDAVSADADVSAEKPQVESVETAAEECLEAEVTVPEPTEEVSEVPQTVEAAMSQSVEIDEVENSTGEADSEIPEEVQTSENHSNDVVLEEVERELVAYESTETPATIDTMVDNITINENIDDPIPSENGDAIVVTAPKAVAVEVELAVEKLRDEPTETVTTVTADAEVEAEPVQAENDPVMDKDDIDVPQPAVEACVPTVDQDQTETAAVDDVSDILQDVENTENPSEEMFESGDDFNPIVAEPTEFPVETPELSEESSATFNATVDIPAMGNSTDEHEAESSATETKEVPAAAEPQAVATESEVVEKISEVPQPVEEPVTHTVSNDQAEVSWEVVIVNNSSEEVVEDVINTNSVVIESTEVTIKASELPHESPSAVKAAPDDGTTVETVSEVIDTEIMEKSVSIVSDAATAEADVTEEQPQAKPSEIVAEATSEREVVDPEYTEEVPKVPQTVEVAISQTAEVVEVKNSTTEVVPGISEEMKNTETHSAKVALEEVEGESTAAKYTETPVKTTGIYDESPTAIDRAVEDITNTDDIGEAIPSQDTEVDVAAVSEAVSAETDVVTENPQDEPTDNIVATAADTELVAEPAEVVIEPITLKDVDDTPQSVEVAAIQTIIDEVQVEAAIVEGVSTVSQEVIIHRISSEVVAEDGNDYNSIAAEATEITGESPEVSSEASATANSTVDTTAMDNSNDEIGRGSGTTEVTDEPVTVEPQVATTETEVTVEQSRIEQAELTEEQTSEADIVIPEAVQEEASPAVADEVLGVPQPVEEPVLHAVSDDKVGSSSGRVVDEVSEEVSNIDSTSEKVVEVDIHTNSAASKSTEVNTKATELPKETSDAGESPDDSNAPAETASEVIHAEVMEASVSTVPDAATAEAVVAAEQQQPDLVEVAVEEVLKTESVAPEPAENLSEESEVVEAAISQHVDVVEVENSTPEVISEISEVNITESQSDDVVGEVIEEKSTASESSEPSAESTEVSKESPATIDTTADNTATTECVDEAITSRYVEVAVAYLPESTTDEADHAVDIPQDELTDAATTITAESKTVAEPVEVVTECAPAEDVTDVSESVDDAGVQTVDKVQTETTIIDEVSVVSQEAVINENPSEEMVDGGDDVDSMPAESTKVTMESSELTGEAPANVNVTVDKSEMDSSTGDAEHGSATSEATDELATAVPDAVTAEPGVTFKQRQVETADLTQEGTPEAEAVVSGPVEEENGPTIVAEISEVPQSVEGSVVCNKEASQVEPSVEVVAVISEEVAIANISAGEIIEGDDISGLVATEGSHSPTKPIDAKGESPAVVDCVEEGAAYVDDHACEESVAGFVNKDAAEEPVSAVIDPPVVEEQAQVEPEEAVVEGILEAESVVPEPSDKVPGDPQAAEESNSQSAEVVEVEISISEAGPEIPVEVKITKTHCDDVDVEGVERELIAPESTETPTERTEVFEESHATSNTTLDNAANTDDIGVDTLIQDTEVVVAAVSEDITVEENTAEDRLQDEVTDKTPTVTVETEVVVEPVEVETETATVNDNIDVPQPVEYVVPQTVDEDQVDTTKVDEVSQEVLIPRSPSVEKVEGGSDVNSIAAESTQIVVESPKLTSETPATVNATIGLSATETSIDEAVQESVTDETTEEPTAAMPGAVTAEPDVTIEQSQAELAESTERGEFEEEDVVTEAVEEETGIAAVGEVPNVLQLCEKSITPIASNAEVETPSAEAVVEVFEKVVTTDTSSEKIAKSGDECDFVAEESTDAPKQSLVSIDSSAEAAVENDCEETAAEEISGQAPEELAFTMPDAIPADANVSAEQLHVESVEVVPEESSEAEVTAPEQVSEEPQMAENSIPQTVDVVDAEICTAETIDGTCVKGKIAETHSGDVDVEEVEREFVADEYTETPTERTEVSEESPAAIETAVITIPNSEGISESTPSQDVEVVVAAVPETITVEENVAVETPLDETAHTSTMVAAETEVVAESAEAVIEPTTVKDVDDVPQPVGDAVSQIADKDLAEPAIVDEVSVVSQETVIPESPEEMVEGEDNFNSIVSESVIAEANEELVSAEPQVVTAEPDVAAEQSQVEPSELKEEETFEAGAVVPEPVEQETGPDVVEEVPDVPQPVDESAKYTVSGHKVNTSSAGVVVEVSEEVSYIDSTSENVIEAGINIDSTAAESTEVTTKTAELSEETSGAVESPDDSNAPAETASEVIATEVMEASVSTVPYAATAEAVVAAEQQQVDFDEVVVEEALKTESVATEPAENLSEESEVVEAAISQPVDVVEVESSTPEVISEISEVNTTESQSDDVVGEDIEGKSTTSESIKPSAESTEVSKESPATIDTTADNTATTECVDEAITSRDTEVAVATLPETIAVEDLAPEKLEDKLTETTAAIATETEVVAESIEVDTEPVTAKDDVDVPQSVEDVVPQTVDEVQVEPTIVEEVSTVSQEVVILNTPSEEMVEGGDDANSIAVESTEVIVEAPGNACATVDVPAMNSSTDDVEPESVTAEATEDPAAALPDAVVVEPDVAVDQSLPEPSEPIENETSETDVIVSDAVEKESGPAVVEEIAEVPQIVDESVIDSVCDETVEAVPAEVAAEGPQEVVNTDSHSEMIVEGGDDSEFVSTESTDTPKESPVSIDSSEEVEVLENDCEEALPQDIDVEATEESVSTVPDAVSADADVTAEEPQVASVETAAEESLEAEVIVPGPTEEVSEVPHSVDDSISQTVEVDKIENSTPEAASEVVEEVQTNDCHADVVVLEGVKGESAVPESTETPVESVEVSEGSPAKIDTAVDNVEDIVESIPSQDIAGTVAIVPEGVPIEEDAATEMPLGESTETTTTVAAEMEAVAASIEVDTEPTVTEANEESATADQQEVTVEHPQIEPAEVVAEEISKAEVVVPESIVEVSEESPSQSVEACQAECAEDEFVPDDSVTEETVEKLEEEVLVATIQDATPALPSENEVEVAVDSLNSVEAAALLYLTTANCSGNKHVTAVPDNSVISSESANAEIPSDAAVDDIVSRDSVTNGPQVSQEDVSEQADDCPEIDDLNSEVIHVVRDQLNAETVDDCSVVMADPPAAVEETSPTASDMVHTPTDDTEMAEAFSQSEIAAAESDDLSSEVAIGATVESDGIKVEAVDKVENAQDVSSVGDILPKLTVDVSDESCESIAVGDGQTTESTISDMNSGTVAISEAVPVTHTETEVVAAVESHVPQTDDRDAPVFVHSGISVETASNSAEPEVNDSQILSVAGCEETVDGIIECEQSFSAAEVVANKKCSNSAQVEPVSPHTVQSNDAASEMGSSAEAASKAEPTQFVETTNVDDDLKPGADDKDEPVGEAVPPATKTENDLVMSETSSNHCVDESTRDTEVATDADCPLQSVAELDPTYSVQVVIVSPLAGQEVTTDEDAGVTFAEVIKEISLSNEPVLNVTNQSAVEDEPLQEPTKVPQDTVANDQLPTDVTPATGECPVVESLTVSHEETDSTTVMDKTSEIPSTEDTTPEIEDGKHSAVVDQTTLPSVTADIPSSCADPTSPNEAADNNENVPSTEQPPHEKESVELLDTTPTAPDEPMSSTSCKESTGFVKPPSTEMATSSPDEPTVVSAPEETEAVECVVTHTVADDASSELPADTYQAEEFPAESAKQPNLEDTLSREVNEGGELPNVADESEPVVNVEPISSVSTAPETSEASLEVSNTVTTAGSCAVESVDHEVAVVAEAVSAEESTSLKDTPASCQDNVDSLNNAVATSTVDTVEKALSEECPPVTNPDLPSVEGKEANVVMVEKQEVKHASSKEVLLTRSNDVQQRSEVNPVEVKVGATTVDQDISVTENHVAAVANKQQEKVVPTACTSKLYETDDGDGQESVASFTTADEGRDIKLHTDTVELGEDNPVPFPTPSRGSTDSAIGMGEAENDPSKVDPSTADVSETPIEGDLATATQTPDNSETPSIASKTSKRRRRRSSVWKRLKGWFTG